VSLAGITARLSQTHLTAQPASQPVAPSVVVSPEVGLREPQLSPAVPTQSGASTAATMPSANIALAGSAVITLQQFKQAISTGDAAVIPTGSLSSFSNDLTTLLQAVQRGDQAAAAKAAMEVENELKTMTVQHHKRMHTATRLPTSDNNWTSTGDPSANAMAASKSSSAGKTSTTALAQAAYDAVANFDRNSSEG
jgi:hypothetical protein